MLSCNPELLDASGGSDNGMTRREQCLWLTNAGNSVYIWDGSSDLNEMFKSCDKNTNMTPGYCASCLQYGAPQRYSTTSTPSNATKPRISDKWMLYRELIA
ncbi:hypothetical protein RB195_019024 [Necator americanus]|uniref:Uncharacterized protein n=1 Tax=Necator americanus TaxID=51031 RepID=A0ABR1CDD1_NECAM